MTHVFRLNTRRVMHLVLIISLLSLLLGASGCVRNATATLQAELLPTLSPTATTSASPLPPTETPTATATPNPTNTPIPSATASPTATATPSPTPSPTPVPNRLPFEAVVQLWTLDENGEEIWSGSGSIISKDGYILTNAHVVLSDENYDVNGLQVSITVKEDEPPVPKYRAETVIFDEALDLAVVHIVSDLDGNPVDLQQDNLPLVPIGNSDAVRLGSPIRILGYPGIGGDTITLTSGEVAGFTSADEIKGRAYIKTSATIAGGNSGGMAIDTEGQLIGIPTQLGYGGEDDIVDCRVLADTNDDGEIDEQDACVPTGGFINALRPINLAKPLIDRALSGEVMLAETPPPPVWEPIDLPDTPGEILFVDNFSTASNTWRTNNNIQLDNGRLSIQVENEDRYEFSIIEQVYDDINYQLETLRLDGPIDNSFGQVLRYQDDENFYAFEISSDGFYAFNKIEAGQWVSLIEWTPSALIDLDSDQNQITSIVRGNSFTFYINDVEVDSITDDSFPQGQLGVIASSYAEGGVDIGFDNVLVRVPSQAQAQATPVPVDDSADSLIYADDFSTPDPGWNTEDSPDVERGLTDGEFYINIISEQTDGWASYELELADVIIEVEARKVLGPELNNYGVMCRYQNPDNYYFLQIGSDGTYAITRYFEGEETLLVDWTSSEAIQGGAATNRLRADCVGSRLQLYANNVLLADIQDSNLQSGQIALGAGTYDEGNVQIRFDNLRLTQP